MKANLMTWKDWHELYLDDIRFDLYLKESLKLLLVKYAHDERGDSFRSMIKAIDKEIEIQCKEYKKVYGDRPPMRRLREEAQKLSS